MKAKSSSPWGSLWAAMWRWAGNPVTKGDAIAAVDAKALATRGGTLLKDGQADAAEHALRAALQIDPSLHEAWSDLGFSLRLLGRPADAVVALEQAVRLDPKDPKARNRLGTVFREQGRSALAEQHYRAALALDPDDADICNNLGAVKNEQGALEEAEKHFRAAVALQPGHALARCNLGVILGDSGRNEEAELCFLAAIESDPTYFYARMNLVMNKLRVVYSSEADAAQARSGYRRALEDLVSLVDLNDRQVVETAAETIGWVSPFYLPYQGKNDRDLQKIYGEFVCRVMARRYPDLAMRPALPAADPDRPLRIGLVSAYFFDHSNWKTPIRGWLENLDRTRFEVFGYYTGSQDDSATQVARAACARFREGMPFEALARAIRDDELHVLIFPEIGMDPTTSKLAALHLAPVQCNSWGHPVTSGMPTIDHFLSADLMEPDNAQEHYTETLVRLPGTSLHYEPPDYEQVDCSREQLGLKPDAILYCCSQSLYKYLPQFDAIFTSIASRVAGAQFVFFSSQRSAILSRQFEDRLEAAFRRAGLDAAAHIVMMPRQEPAKFRASLNRCDVYLDSVEWSGCNTTLEALVCDLPVITCRGELMRGRHSAAFLETIELAELIADEVPAYIELAVRLGNDASLRNRIRAEIRAKRHLAYRDLAPVRGLENFLAQVTRRA